MIANKFSSRESLPSRQTTLEASSAQIDQPAKSRQDRSHYQFFELSQNTGVSLHGVAGANLNNTQELLFFPNAQDLGPEQAVVVPMRRVRGIEVLSDVPEENTPLEFPSLWSVRIHLHPTEAARKEELFTVFESD